MYGYPWVGFVLCFLVSVYAFWWVTRDMAFGWFMSFGMVWEGKGVDSFRVMTRIQKPVTRYTWVSVTVLHYAWVALGCWSFVNIIELWTRLSLVVWWQLIGSIVGTISIGYHIGIS